MPIPPGCRAVTHSIIFSILQIVCLSSATPVFAGEIVGIDGKTFAISVSGRIELGDEKVFINLIRTAPKARIILAGPGGNVVAALTIGQEIRARNLQTLVPAGASCASACALIWLAGTTRMLGVDARIGFHALSAPHRNSQFAETHAFDPVLMHYLLELGYAGDATATIVNTPSVGIRWLDRIELNSNGFAAQSYP